MERERDWREASADRWRVGWICAALHLSSNWKASWGCCCETLWVRWLNQSYCWIGAGEDCGAKCLRGLVAMKRNAEWDLPRGME